MMTDEFDVGSVMRRAMEDAMRNLGRANILIAGRTGVGKSTLVNTVFQGNIATTGQGRPVTQSTREYSKEGIPLSIFDTRGLEMADFGATMDELEKLISTRRNDGDPMRHIHVAWVCIAEDSRRVEDAESHLVSLLNGYMPVVAVITKARADQGFRDEVQRLLPLASNVIRIRALPDQLDDGHVLPPMGLLDLVDLTMELIPKAHRDAFAAAQKVDIGKKRTRSHAAVATAAGLAAAAGATPIPFSDAAVLIPIQVGMLASITAIFGVPPAEGLLTALIGSAAGGSIATLTGRAAVGGLLKLFPGAGTVVGGIIAASTAAALTTALGEAYIATLALLFTRNQGDPPSPDEIIATFREQLTAKR
jgi:uncharacterized protein (DUF697 family)